MLMTHVEPGSVPGPVSAPRQPHHHARYSLFGNLVHVPTPHCQLRCSSWQCSEPVCTRGEPFALAQPEEAFLCLWIEEESEDRFPAQAFRVPGLAAKQKRDPSRLAPTPPPAAWP